MDMQRARARLAGRFPSSLTTIDSHTAGEPTRLVVDGFGEPPGADMAGKRRHFMEHSDRVRRLLTREPRGHRDMVAAALTEPVTEGAAFGLVYMDARRYPYLCGHATIGAVTTLLEAGAIDPAGPETRVTVDTPSGPMETVARMRDGVVTSVAIRAVPSFVYGSERSLEVPGLGRIPVHTVCVGGFFVMVPAERTGLDLVPENGTQLTDLGMRIIDCANEQLEVQHPMRPEVSTVDVVEFYQEDAQARSGRSMVIYGERHMDRSPCGTGTAAKLTLLHRQGRLDLDSAYRNTSPLGTVFEARLVQETRVGDLPAVVAEIRGSAHITGFHTFVLDPDDPFPGGFLP
jgi:proline racemase